MERKLTKKERDKRGCSYCLDTGDKEQVWHCPHDECPYTVLDKYETYDDYMKSEDSKIDIETMLDTGWLAGRLVVGASSTLKVLRKSGRSILF
jgi:hypothetical protein